MPLEAGVSHLPNGAPEQPAGDECFITWWGTGAKETPLCLMGGSYKAAFSTAMSGGYRAGGRRRREERDGGKRVESERKREGWSERREEKSDLLLPVLFIC